ncbi:hypothetical protein Nepgr_018184 [Nepenthes gracilis]|uniref:Uncharacterized protein n=1 Tax=Nepenthes gracilis TaxID=150966 RepID=A0AAD3SRU0_NEPGR|nr:hypothetical protein Nepgr_018184 [Nepenthes gracilis]
MPAKTDSRAVASSQYSSPRASSLVSSQAISPSLLEITMSLCLSALEMALETLLACTHTKKRVRNCKPKDKAGNRIYTSRILRAALSGLAPSSRAKGGEQGKGPTLASLAATSVMNSAIGISRLSSVLTGSLGK